MPPSRTQATRLRSKVVAIQDGDNSRYRHVSKQGYPLKTGQVGVGQVR